MTEQTTTSAPQASPETTTPTTTTPNTRNYNITDFEFPEGFQATPQELQAMIKLVNEAPGRKATVNGLLGFAMQRANEQLASMQAAQRAEHEAWAKSLAEDKDFGGAKFAPTQNEVKRVLAQFGSPALEKVLNETGLGNHPELFRFFARVAGVTKEARPGPTAGAKPANGAMSQEDLAKRFFSGSTAQG